MRIFGGGQVCVRDGHIQQHVFVLVDGLLEELAGVIGFRSHRQGAEELALADRGDGSRSVCGTDSLLEASVTWLAGGCCAQACAANKERQDEQRK